MGGGGNGEWGCDERVYVYPSHVRDIGMGQGLGVKRRGGSDTSSSSGVVINYSNDLPMPWHALLRGLHGSEGFKGYWFQTSDSLDPLAIPDLEGEGIAIYNHWDSVVFKSFTSLLSLPHMHTDEFVYTFKCIFDLKGDSDTANQGTLPELSEFPLSSANLL
ncbi:hypothetical protein ASPTUDRAFT_29655 [Aspergillus tubingensis CBS 134.48]|uniref:Uncharacterized protein n=1 Tax=Aspergillus tubingensis (strain CBS 134.48) TaxID=767770 RepID=A0A1L9N310_ASPTC|nr:hypothetical protein ASPTUDRAFT_29655 [Aspergillus tubingensis CBS 134.48]